MPDQSYAQEEVLVSTQWVADNLHRTDKVRTVSYTHLTLPTSDLV